MIQGGVPRINAIALMEFKATCVPPGRSLTGTAAFVDTRSGHTHGQAAATSNVWSQETHSRLQDLIDAMERDLVRLHFGEDAEEASGREAEPGGLGDHLGSASSFEPNPA